MCVCVCSDMHLKKWIVVTKIGVWPLNLSIGDPMYKNHRLAYNPTCPPLTVTIATSREILRMSAFNYYVN